MVLFENYMPNGNIGWGIVIVVVIFVLYTFVSAYCIYSVGYNTIGGFWCADPSFCEESGLDRFYIFIEPPNKGNMCWICMTGKSGNKSHAIVNHMTTYNINTKWLSSDNWTTNIEHPRTYTITFNELPDNLSEKLFPQKQNLKLEISTGKMYLLNKPKVYFVGYKDSRISDLIDVDKKNLDNDESMDVINDDDDSINYESE